MYHKSTQAIDDRSRVRVVAIFFLVLAIWIVVRLFMLQIVQHDYYALFALNSHEIYQRLHPDRGRIYFKDSRTKIEYPAAVNKEFFIVYANPREISPEETATTSVQVGALLGQTPEEQKTTLAKLSNHSDSYAVIAKKVPSDVADRLTAATLKGIYATGVSMRYYPEGALAGAVLGFTGSDSAGNIVGRYGIEGYWEKKLAGKGGFTMGEKGALGSWISLADRTTVPSENGADLVLTIDRAVESAACERLRQGLKDYNAKSAALVLMNPKTGAILAMCSLPDYDPNNYSKADDLSVYNNTAIFTAYEPGSVFKAFTMGAGLDLGLVTPNTTYTDPCERIINGFHVRNAMQSCYGEQTMTEVLEKSINTGAVWVEEKVGADKFRQYIEKFGFGDKTGIALNTEVSGDVSSLKKKGEIFGANGSFGQGLTATALQVAAGYAAIANGGKLMKPYVVDQVRYPGGEKETATPMVVEQVISEHAAKLLGAMLVSVVENHYKAAKINTYYVVGKTGTAQIAERGVYSDNRTNHTFAGFAPAADPALVLVVKYEEPERKWAEQTALPVFKDVMQFALNYYAIPGDR